MVFGVKCTQDAIYVSILEGSVDKPFGNEERIKIVIKASKTIKIRGSILEDMKKEFKELLVNYQPSIIGLKKAENSAFKVSVQSQISKGEIEGVVRLVSNECNVTIIELLYSQIKPRIKAISSQKKELHNFVNDNFNNIKLCDDNRDAILAGWATLNE